MKYSLVTEKETKKLANTFSSIIETPAVIGITGELGSGKTAFVRNFIQKYEPNEKVKSPTFGLLEEYNYENISIIHADLYRIKEGEQNYIDFNDYYSEKSLFLIEWIENDLKLMQNSDILININISNKTNLREFSFHSNSDKGKTILINMKNAEI